MSDPSASAIEMSPAVLLAELEARHVVVWSEGDRILVRAPDGAIDARLRAAIVSGKSGLLDELAQREIGIADRTSPIRASFEQERFWFLQQLDPGAPTYNLPCAYRIRGELDVAALARAFDSLVARHEALRTTFDEVDGQPMLHFRPPATGLLCVEDFDGGDEALEARADAQARAAFDLCVGPLYRATLLRRSKKESVLLLTLHHAISDGPSVALLVKELCALYSSHSRGVPSPLPSVQFEYADYAAWQRRFLVGRRLDEGVRFWTRCLAGAPAAIDLPTDRTRRTAQHVPSGSVPVNVPPHVATGLTALARGPKATLYMTLLAAFGAFLSRHTGQSDVVIGSPVAGRSRPELESSVGVFQNNLPLRVSLSGDPSFVELLQRTTELCLGAFSHQDVPFQTLVDVLGVSRAANRNPLYQVMFTLDQLDVPEGVTDGLSFVPIALGNKGSGGLDLALLLQEGGEGIGGLLEYNSELFDASTVERMRDRFLVFLEDIVRDPTRTMSRFAITSEQERRALVEWNATDRDLAESHCIHELFEAQAARTPDAVAVEFESACITYGDLDARANRLAHMLVKRGVRPGHLVAVCMDRCVEMVVSLYAVLKAGAAYAPLDPSHPGERLRFLLEDLAAPVVLVTSATESRVAGAQVVRVDRDIDGELPVSKPDVRHRDAHIAYVIYTSGSTGTPKGVMNSHAGLRNRLLWMQGRYQLGPDDSVLQKTPYTFDVSVWEFFWPLMFGARLVVAQPDGHKDPEYLVNVMRTRGVTTVHFVPSMLGVFLERADVASTSLRRVICSGEALPRAMQDTFFERLARCELHNLYGPTEASIDVSYWQCRSDDSHADVPIGRPIWNTQLHVLDKHDNPCPIGVAGELCIGGVGLARGYWRRPELTAERFVPDPFSPLPGARMYRTGDLARWLPDGALGYLGRIDHQVKLRGFRIELGEIEQVMLQHASVREAAVLVREDVPGDKRLVAYVVPRASRDSWSADELRDDLRARLPEYMIPSAFVVLEQLPVTVNGKLDRAALPRPDTAAKSAQYEAPTGPIERGVAEIWSVLLQVERVGATDNFFELGGHSLLLTRLKGRIEAEFGIQLSLRAMFDAPTVRRMTELIAHTRATSVAQTVDVNTMLDELAGLSDEEVAALLAGD
jgi:amino acid adenylation domain-containing protein